MKSNLMSYVVVLVILAIAGYLYVSQAGFSATYFVAGAPK